MTTTTWIIIAIVAIVVIVAAFAAIRHKQRSGDIVATSGRGTNNRKGTS